MIAKGLTENLNKKKEFILSLRKNTINLQS